MKRLCYVAAPSYSGSTLLTLLLGTHPQIATVGELKGRLYSSRTPPRQCSCGREVTACAFWREVAARLAARGLACELPDLDCDFRAPGRPAVDALLRTRVRGARLERLRHAALRAWPGADRERARLVARNRALIEVIASLQGGEVLLDASKDATRLAFLLHAQLWEIRVVHLLRDGRGTAHSFRERDGLAIRAAARRWKNAHTATASLLAGLPASAVHVVRYEDLATRPHAALAGVLDFLGLDPDGATLAFRQRAHHVFGNPMRFSDSDAIRLDERWKKALRPRELRAFDRIAGDLNRAFGYRP